MSVTLVETPAAANANTYATEAEALAYFAARLPLAAPWSGVTDKTAALAMAARVLNVFVQASRTLVYGDNRVPYYVTRRAWTGTPTTITQALAWPRTGMYDVNGNAIGTMVIPQALKDAQIELAGQLAAEDTTLDNDIRARGIKSISVSSVSISFKEMISQHVLPDAVWMLLPISWLTDELYVPAQVAMFDVVPD